MRVSVRKKVPVTQPAVGHAYGYTTEPDGFLVGDVFLEIDVNTILAQMGQRAIKSKGRRCVGLSGLVKVKAKNVRKVAA